MREFIMRHKVGAVTILAALVVAALTIYAVPLNPPLGDCYGGALSQDPLHCYTLEQAESQDVIDIDAIYDVNGALYVSITHSKDTLSDVHDYMRAKSTEFYDRWPEDVPVLSFYDACMERLIGVYRECYLKVGLGRAQLPKSVAYNDIEFFIGGDGARRSTPGWASWRQLWPATTSGASGSSTSGASTTTSSTFDVSDVDMTDLPVVACPEKLSGVGICSRDQDVALSITGRHSQWGEAYFQIKDPPEDAAELAALKEILFPCYDKVGTCTYTATTTERHVVDGVETYIATTSQVLSSTRTRVTKVEIVPVKYGPGELLRWVEILNRFALSTGNTIGLYEATIDNNKENKGFKNVVFTSAGPGPAKTTKDGRYDLSKVRTTILLAGFDAHRIANALPILLPLLGIPVDAVGVVGTFWNEGNDYIIPGVKSSGAPAPTTRLASSLNVPLPLLLLARNVGAVLVAGGIIALVLRLRRRRAPG